MHEVRGFHHPRRPRRIDAEHPLQEFVHAPASELIRKPRLGTGGRLHDDGLDAPERVPRDAEHVHPFRIRQRSEPVRTEHPVEVGDDLIQEGDGVVHASIQQGATDIPTPKTSRSEKLSDQIPRYGPRHPRPRLRWHQSPLRRPESDHRRHRNAPV